MNTRLPEPSRTAGTRMGNAVATVTCPRCGTRFGCGASAPGCWCEALPPLAEPAPGSSCYCPECLRSLSAPRQSGTDDAAPPATRA